jgi:hypothetical protein
LTEDLSDILKDTNLYEAREYWVYIKVGECNVVKPSFTVGIEEEYLLVNHETDELSEYPPLEIFT